MRGIRGWILGLGIDERGKERVCELGEFGCINHVSSPVAIDEYDRLFGMSNPCTIEK
jgi:hypothetical protein